MDRRRDRRVNVNMNATILQGGELPIGCRVGNVSTSGIMLKQDSNGPKLPGQQSEVEVRLSLKQDDSRKVIELPVKIVREARDQIGGKFDESQPQLLKLVTPNEDAQVHEINARRSAERKKSQAPEPIEPEDSEAFPTNQLAIWVAIVLLFAFVGVLHFDNQNLNEALAATQAQLAAIETEPAPATSPQIDMTEQLAPITGQLALLNERTTALEQRPIPEPAPVLTPVQEITPAIPTSENWIVNLLSLTNERAALDFAQGLQAKGIDAVVNAETNDSQSQIFRVQVDGFPNRQSAVKFSEQTKALLDLKGVWVYRE